MITLTAFEWCTHAQLVGYFIPGLLIPSYDLTCWHGMHDQILRLFCVRSLHELTTYTRSHNLLGLAAAGSLKRAFVPELFFSLVSSFVSSYKQHTRRSWPLVRPAQHWPKEGHGQKTHLKEYSNTKYNIICLLCSKST